MKILYNESEARLVAIQKEKVRRFKDVPWSGYTQATRVWRKQGEGAFWNFMRKYVEVDVCGVEISEARKLRREGYDRRTGN